jgi:rod shape-determining protein MreD
MALKVFSIPALPRVNNGAARLLPVATTLLAAVISVLPLQIPGYAALTPVFTLMAAYHWTIYRPDLLPISLVFGLGLLLDLLNGSPYLGVSALMLLVARTAVLVERRHVVNRPFTVLWLGFLALAAGTFAFGWAFVSALRGQILGTRPFIFEAVLTVACYPVGSWLLARLHRALVRA